MTPATPAPRATPLPDLARLWTDAPAFAGLALVLTLALLPLYTAMAIDSRSFVGESPWLKPVKFHYALVIYLITLAFFARYLPDTMRSGLPWRAFAIAVSAAVLAEVIWLSAAAALNTASHFNTERPVFAAIYPVMGALAVLLTAASLVMGLAIWRNPATGLPGALQLSCALGLILTFAATLPVAGFMAGSPGHAVGAATRHLWLLGWARDAGDLRVAHFLATHALHAVPLAGLAATRLLAATAAWAALIAFTFAQARAGQPFLPWLG
jgi:hypothetical protein